MNESAKASEVRPSMPLTTPLTSVEMICGTSCLTLEFALDEPDLSTPRSFSQPSIRSAPAEAFCEIESCWAVMPPITTTTTAAAIAASASRTITAAAARGMCRASRATTGPATVATIVPATTGPTIVSVVPSSQPSTASRAKTPSSSQHMRPRSRSQRGEANTDASSPASAGASSNIDGAGAGFLRRRFGTCTAG